jgi:hypothetical protein
VRTEEGQRERQRAEGDLVVDLEVRCFHREWSIFRGSILEIDSVFVIETADEIKESSADPRDDPRACFRSHHAVRLAASSLAICRGRVWRR